MNFLNRSFIFILFFLSVLNAKANGSETVIEIDQPRFSEKGLDQKSYEIKAQKGLRSSEKLILFDVEGKFKTNNGLWIYMNANEGNYQQTKNTIRLSDNVKFYTDDGDKITSNNAIFKMDEDLIILRKNVFHENKELRIKSDTTTISNNFDNILHEGNVLTEILK
tara:strand:- start:581 stop:1075 length:495 start_codon:yes stop_codon:yes gene_type:complete